MKIIKKLYSLIAFICIALNSYGQDVIVTKNGLSILSKIIDISNDKIRYRKWESQDGPIYVLTPEEISFIDYQNGEKIFFNKNIKENNINSKKDIWGSNYNVNDINQMNYKYEIKRLKDKARGNRILGYISALVGIGGGIALSSYDDTTGWIFMGTGTVLGGIFTIKSIKQNNKAKIMEQNVNQKLYSINVFEQSIRNGNNIYSCISICKDKIMDVKSITFNLNYIF